MNLACWLDRAAKAFPSSAAIARGSVVTHDYRRFADRASRLASGLRGFGLQPGDRVAIAARNRVEYLEVLYGAWWGGLAVVPINAKLHAAEVGWIVEHADASVLFVDTDIKSVPRDSASSLREIVTIGSSAYARLFSAEPLSIASRTPEDLAWLFYTSGTTGRPKGAMLSHRNLAAMSFAYLSDVDTVAPGDALLHAAPMSHGSGLYVMPHVMRMGTNVIPESGGFDPAEVAANIDARPRTSMFAAPTMVKRLVRASDEFDPANIRTLIYGGAPMHVADAIGALDRFGPRLAQIYGQGETPMTVTVLSKTDVANRDHPRWLERLGSVGLVNSAVEVCVAGAEDDPLHAGQLGEILVRGDTVMTGYWSDPDSSTTALRSGWLHTGDIGMFDEQGYLTLKDRSKDVIISGGANIYPREVEEVLLTHRDVQEVSVIGRPDSEWGEVVVAFVVGSANPHALDQHCLARIARFKRPKDYVFLRELPRNNYGKILKTTLREIDAVRFGAA